MDSSANPALVENAPAETAANTESDGLVFHGRAWARLGDPTAVRVGGIVPRPEIERVKLQLPRVGDIVHQGLPLFAVGGCDANTTTVPAPVTGMVLEVNSALENHPELLWEHPCGLGWVAKIAPTRLEREQIRLETRGVAAATLNHDFLEFYRDKLSRIGCTVHVVDPTDSDALLAMARTTGVVLLDTASCGPDGHETVGHLLEEIPDTKIVVVAPTGAPQQDAYRAHRLFYYAVPPLEDEEILDIVDSCYRLASLRKPATPAPSSQNLPISALHVDTGEGRKVTVLVPGGLLERELGLGLELRTKLLQRLLPLETGLGDLKMTPARVLREASKNDRVIVLTTSEMSRIPGSLAPRRHGCLTEFVGVEAQNVTVLAIQPMIGNPGMPKLDPETLDSLAEHIVSEILA